MTDSNDWHDEVFFPKIRIRRQSSFPGVGVHAVLSSVTSRACLNAVLKISNMLYRYFMALVVKDDASIDALAFTLSNHIVESAC